MTDHLKEIIENSTEVRAKLDQMNGEIKKLDEEVASMLAIVKEKTLLYCKNQKTLKREQKNKAAKEIQTLHTEMMEKSQKKAEIAKKMYDFIDDRIRDLDKKTQQFNMKMFKKSAEEQRKHTGSSNATGTSTRGEKKRKHEDSKKSRIAETAEYVTDFKPLQLETMDMPVNPNEPRYCVCHQVSFGEMIACDNPTCKYEWFHYQCIGITKAPPGEFICEYCKGNKVEKKKK